MRHMELPKERFTFQLFPGAREYRDNIEILQMDEQEIYAAIYNNFLQKYGTNTIIDENKLEFLHSQIRDFFLVKEDFEYIKSNTFWDHLLANKSSSGFTEFLEENLPEFAPIKSKYPFHFTDINELFYIDTYDYFYKADVTADALFYLKSIDVHQNN